MSRVPTMRDVAIAFGIHKFPVGYGTEMVSMLEMRRRFGPKMHPEFRRRVFKWIKSQDGIGIGSGWRSTQPLKPGFAPEGKSFHQTQTFASGKQAYCAVDLVHVDPGHVHRSPTWEESKTAPFYGVHTFVDDEPWHMQPVEIFGWGSWVSNGRPDPKRWGK